MNASTRQRKLSALLLLVATLLTQAHAADPVDYTVQASATVQSAPPLITLHWPTNAASSYDIYRRDYDSAGPWNSVITNLSDLASNFPDTNVSVGLLYEYKIVMHASPTGHGYLASGIEIPVTEDRGNIILLVDDTYTLPLSNELLRLELDLIGDGWDVLRHDVSPSESVTNVKNIVQADYLSDPAATKTLLLFGNIPVPYSGNLNPDGHPEHLGAWPADVYYADMDGTWTDSTVTSTNAVQSRHHNIPGDGKFDQSGFLDAELQVGRIDLSDMPAFTTNSLALLRQYLDKNHDFRHAVTTTPQRALIDDHFGEFAGEAFAANGWRAGSAFFGATNVHELNWLTTLDTDVYMLAYGCGGGTYTSCGGIGNTSQFAANDPKAVFNMLFGSYFGDWDNQDNFLRAPLCTSRGLVSFWAGRPNWFIHPMAIGRTIGEATTRSQNNTGADYDPAGGAPRQVHMALMGDPTLRLHAVAPASTVRTIAQTGSIVVTWSASPDVGVSGYHVYRSTSPDGSYSRLNGSLITGTNFSDNAPLAGDAAYMVRAVKLENSASGSYYNPAQGIIWSHIRDYADWQFNHFRFAGTDGHPDADPDGDGLSNANEFHYGTDPNNATHSHHPPQIVEVTGNDADVEYTRGGYVSPSNVTHYITEDLGTPWVPAVEGVHFQVLSEVTNATSANVTSGLRFLNATNGVLFIRTEISQ